MRRSGSHLSEVALDCPAATRELGCDLGYGPAFGAEPSGFDGSIRRRRRRGFDLEDRGDVIPGGGAEPAVPSRASTRLFGPKSQRQTGKAGGATLATKERQLVGPPFLGVVGVDVCPGAYRLVEIATGGVVNEIAKLLLPPNKEVRMMHRLLQLVGDVPGPLWLGFPGELGKSRRTRLVPSGPEPGVAQAAAGQELAPRRTGA